MAKRLPYDVPAGNVITMRNVYKTYSKNTAALNGISLDIAAGEFVFIVGDSGSGKSTLIKLLLHELRATEGDINVLGYDMATLPRRKVAKFRRNMGIVFQDFRLLKDRTVYENVAFAQRIIQTPSREMKVNVPRTLNAVGLGQKGERMPTELSGGEQQRVALARAIVNRPYVLLCDEPTGNLDPRNSWDIMKRLEQVNVEEGTTVVVVTHNREIVNAMHKRVITMKKGVIVSDEQGGGYTEAENRAYEEAYPENAAAEAPELTLPEEPDRDRMEAPQRGYFDEETAEIAAGEERYAGEPYSGDDFDDHGEYPDEFEQDFHYELKVNFHESAGSLPLDPDHAEDENAGFAGITTEFYDLEEDRGDGGY